MRIHIHTCVRNVSVREYAYVYACVCNVTFMYNASVGVYVCARVYVVLMLVFVVVFM